MLDPQVWIDSIRAYEEDSRQWRAQRRPAKVRNVLGLIAHNLLRHVDAKHGGLYRQACPTCRRMTETYNTVTRELQSVEY